MQLKNVPWKAAALLAVGFCATASAQVQHGTLDVVENDDGNNPTSVSVTPSIGYGSWSYISDDEFNTSSRGDYYLDFGTGFDYQNGVLMVGSYELERTEESMGEEPFYATIQHAHDTNDRGRFWVVAQESPGGGECNANAALAYFPISDGWYCGGAYCSSNGGNFTEFVGHPDIVLSNNFDPNLPNYDYVLVDQYVGNGQAGLHLDGIDMRRDGVLLVCGSKNEDNFGMVYVDVAGDALLLTHDNGANGANFEQDPVSFVFVPEGTDGVTMGRVSGSGRTVFGQGNFDVELYGYPDIVGTYRLTIDGESPSTGTLIVTPYNELSGYSIDNPIFVEPDGDGWLLNGRDIAGMGLQYAGSHEVAFHFAFFKNGMDINPGTPSKYYLEKENDVVSARFEVTEYAPDNGTGDMYAERFGSENLDVFADNRGDVGISWLQARMRSYLSNGMDRDDGVFLGNPTEFVRDNYTTGGLTAWSTLSFDNASARTHAATDTGGEMNNDFALAFFPVGAGFQQDADVQVHDFATTEASTIGVKGDPDEGVLLAMNWDNNNRYVSVSLDVTTNGDDAWFLTAWDGTTGLQAVDWDYGYVWLPYNTEGLIAGQIDADGTVISGTGNFTIGSGANSAWGFPVTTITIPGVNAATDGVLVVTSLNEPYAMSWEANAAGYFEVAGLDIGSQTPGRRPFAFAFIQYDSDLAAPEFPAGDINFDGEVNLDDWALMSACLAGPNVTSVPAECTAVEFEASDLDNDGDADLADAAVFTTLFE